jgi:16S rRNA (guanine527-N7)-methyltransferase
MWRRHFLDSAQLIPLLPPGTSTLADIGSGAGFPGLVLAILGIPEVHLIETNARKSIFLREAARAAGLTPGKNPIIHESRAEKIGGLNVDVVTARACAPLPRLLGYAERFLRSDSQCLFLKGKGADEELTEARKAWSMSVERIASRTSTSGVILRIRHLGRIH